MKKHLFTVMALAATLTLGLTSCTKEDPASPLVIDMQKTATVEGTLLVNPDITKAPADQKYDALKDVQIVAYVKYSTLNPNASTGSYTVKATYTSSTGKFSVVVPATEDGVTVTFAVSDVAGEQKQVVGPDNVTIVGTWSFNIPSQSLKAGQKKVIPFVAGSFAPGKESGSKVN